MVKYADSPMVEVAVDVDAPPSAVWALVTDVDLPARFSEEFQGGEWIDGAGPARRPEPEPLAHNGHDRTSDERFR